MNVIKEMNLRHDYQGNAGCKSHELANRAPSRLYTVADIWEMLITEAKPAWY